MVKVFTDRVVSFSVVGTVSAAEERALLRALLAQTAGDPTARNFLLDCLRHRALGNFLHASNDPHGLRLDFLAGLRPGE